MNVRSKETVFQALSSTLCLSSSIVYTATVKHDNKEAKYIGLASTSFKIRYRNHIQTFRNRNYSTSTSLSKFIWNLQDKNIKYNIDWKILSKAPTYNAESKRCQLCILEKTFILLANEKTSLNKRHEILNKCKHRDKLLLMNT